MSFSQQIAQFGVQAAGRIENVRKGVIIKLFSAVILDTPVDTGRARANWQVSENAPIKNETGTTDKSGRAPIAAVEAAAKNSNGDVSIYLSNNVPYIGRLEDGYSRKAPEGMVKRNVIRFARLIKIEVSKK